MQLWDIGQLDRRQIVLGSAAGLVVTCVVFVALRQLTPEIMRGLGRVDVTEARVAVLWMLLLGIVLGFVILATRSNPLVSAVPAVLLFIAYSPLVIDTAILEWYPGWLSISLSLSAGPTPFAIIGLLAGVAGWNIVRRLRAPGPDQSTSQGVGQNKSWR